MNVFKFNFLRVLDSNFLRFFFKAGIKSLKLRGKATKPFLNVYELKINDSLSICCRCSDFVARQFRT